MFPPLPISYIIISLLLLFVIWAVDLIAESL